MLMKNKTLTLTIVIPAYNEQDYLKGCLDSIAAQAVMPDEVIVVDNNSSDDTVKIAQAYGFVRVLHESNQHQSFAQKTGFNAARSDVIGRIDADSVLPADWVKKVKTYFADDRGLVAVTGNNEPYDTSLPRTGTSLFKFYVDRASQLAGGRMLWGANCALRRSAWLKISHQVMTRGDIWEDYDLAFCLAPHGRIRFADDIAVGSSLRSVYKPLLVQLRYQLRAVRTFYFRTSKLRTMGYVLLCMSMYLVFLLTLIDRFVLKPAQNSVAPVEKPVKAAAKVVPLKAE